MVSNNPPAAGGAAAAYDPRAPLKNPLKEVIVKPNRQLKELVGTDGAGLVGQIEGRAVLHKEQVQQLANWHLAAQLGSTRVTPGT